MEAPLFKTSPDTHPVAWVQSEDLQQRMEGGREGGWRMGGVRRMHQKLQLSPGFACVPYTRPLRVRVRGYESISPSQMFLGESALFSRVDTFCQLSSSRGHW